MDGCILSLLKRERDLNVEDKTLLQELKQQYLYKVQEQDNDKDVLIMLLKKSKKEDELFHQHKYMDLEREVIVLRKEKSLLEHIELSKKEKERLASLESEVFKTNKEKLELEKKFEKMREQMIEHNTTKAQELYDLFEKHKGMVQPQHEFNNLVNDLFMAPFKFFYSK